MSKAMDAERAAHDAAVRASEEARAQYSVRLGFTWPGEKDMEGYEFYDPTLDQDKQVIAEISAHYSRMDGFEGITKDDRGNWTVLIHGVEYIVSE